jgi:long-subunit acyl-CoA synthetase (AMP-forming)
MSTNKNYISPPIRGVRRYPTIPGFLARAVRTYGDRVALRLPLSREGRLTIQETTYRELWDFSGRLAGWLHSRGVREGDRVAIVAKPSLGWAVTFIAVQRLGAVAMPLDAGLQAPEIRRLLLEAEASMLFCAPERYPELLALKKDVPGLLDVVALEKGRGRGFPLGRPSQGDIFCRCPAGSRGFGRPHVHLGHYRRLQGRYALPP